MIKSFKADFHWMLRESTGYFPWIDGRAYRLIRHLRWGAHRKCMMCDEGYSERGLVKILTEESVCDNPLLDLVLKALIRAEIRLLSRFIPQNSHEERLTGNLVSEIDNSILMINDNFIETSKSLYGIEKDIDFFYYDMSRGGTIEKYTGADLGLIIVIDLPDYPYTVKSILIQAKKISGDRAKIDRRQYETLNSHGVNGGAYLFYDMDLSRRCSPLITMIGKQSMNNLYKKCVEDNNSSFSYEYETARTDGHPLSLFLLSNFANVVEVGSHHNNFDSALNMFKNIGFNNRNKTDYDHEEFKGRLGILSIGNKIKYSMSDNERFDITI